MTQFGLVLSSGSDGPVYEIRVMIRPHGAVSHTRTHTGGSGERSASLVAAATPRATPPPHHTDYEKFVNELDSKTSKAEAGCV